MRRENFAMDTYGKRLAKAMEHAKLLRVDLARAVGCSVQAVGQALKGKTSGFAIERHLKAAAACRVNQAWLFSGEGEMLDLTPSAPIDGITNMAHELALYFDEAIPAGRQLRAVAFNAACNAIADAKRQHAAQQNEAPPVAPTVEKLS